MISIKSFIDLIQLIHVVEPEYLSDLLPKEVVFIFGILRPHLLALRVL